MSKIFEYSPNEGIAVPSSPILASFDHHAFSMMQALLCQSLISRQLLCDFGNEVSGGQNRWLTIFP